MTEAIDTLRMYERTLSWPDEIAAAAERAQGQSGLPSHDAIENVIIVGSGSSARAARAVQAVTESIIPVPVVAADGFAVPAFVSEGSLVFALSSSGNTDATVEGATQAAALGAHVVVVSGDGQLKKLAEQWNASYVEVPEAPRPVLPALIVPVLVTLEEVGLFVGASAWIERAMIQVTQRVAELEARSEADNLATVIDRTIPVVYGGGAIGAAAAEHWKTQFNLNVKTPAFAAAYPDAAYADISGWGQNGDVTRQLFTAIVLRTDEEPPLVPERFAVAAPMVREVVHELVEVQAAGEGDLAQLFDLMVVGEFASLAVAQRLTIDPGPTPAVDALKYA